MHSEEYDLMFIRLNPKWGIQNAIPLLEKVPEVKELESCIIFNFQSDSYDKNLVVPKLCIGKRCNKEIYGLSDHCPAAHQLVSLF